MSSLTKGTVRIKLRQDSSSNWTSQNPTLASGELGFETDSGMLKVGDGSTAWTALTYVGEFTLVDGDGTSFTMNQTNFLTLNEGTGIDINHTDTTGATRATTISCDLRGEELSSVLTAGGNATDGHVLTATGSGTAAWEAASGGGGSDFKKQYISALHRWGTDSSPSTAEFYGGYAANWSRSAIFYGLTATDDTDTSAYGWTIINYGDFLAHAACTVTGMSAVARQDNANADVELCLFKATIADDNSHTANQDVDFICKVSWTANADTSSVHAVHSTASINATAAELDAGDMLFLAFRYTSAGSTDARYWYIRHTIEITYD